MGARFLVSHPVTLSESGYGAAEGEAHRTDTGFANM